jgi:cytochrome c peroxidase
MKHAMPWIPTLTLALALGCGAPPADTAATTSEPEAPAGDVVVRTGEPIQPIPRTVDADPAKVELGRKLFFDPRLSRSGFISCNSCHNLSTGGVDNLPSSIGHGWQLGPINSPTVLNARWNLAQFWDGRAKDLKEQAGGPVANPMEMAFSHDAAIDVLATIPAYVDEFQRVYGGLTMDAATDAIAVFEETLITPDAPFDRWLRGDDGALTAEQLEGYGLFKSKGCTVCHAGIAVGGQMFQKMGLVKPYTRDLKTLGRYEVTRKEADKYVFKVPVLRNIELTYPYFHDGSVWDLKEAVSLMADLQLGQQLTDEEATRITAFLKSLTGVQPQVLLPILPPSTPETPRPDPRL